MREERARGRGSSARPGCLGPGLVALCLWLGLAASTAAQETVTQLVIERESFSNKPEDGKINTTLDLTSGQLPEDLKTLMVSGDVELLPRTEQVKILRGNYEIEAGQLTAKFAFRRIPLLAQEFDRIRFMPSDSWRGAELPLNKNVTISAVIPKSLELLPDPESTAQLEPSFEFGSNENAQGTVCNWQFVRRTTFERVPLKILKDPEVTQQQGGFIVAFQLGKVTKPVSDVDLILGLCQGDDHWVYRGALPEIQPPKEQEASIVKPQAPEDPEQADERGRRAVPQSLRTSPFLWGIFGVSLALAIFALVQPDKVRSWFWRDRKTKAAAPQTFSSPPSLAGEGNGPFPESFPGVWKAGLTEVMQSQLLPLHRTMQGVQEALGRVWDHQMQFPAGAGEPPSDYSMIEAQEQQVTSPSHRSPQAQPVAALTELVNRWWSDGPNRESLADLIGPNSAVKPYRSFNVQDSLRNTTNRTFLFQPSENLVEWLGRSQQGDLFLVPGDPKLFQTGDSLKFLGVLFEGLGTSLSDVRFRRVVRACRLKREPGSTDRYRLAERGILELGGQAAVEARHSPGVAPSRAPKPGQVLQEREIADVVSRIVREAIPRGLPEQIHELSQHVLALSQGGVHPRTESSRPDANISAALSELRQGLSTLAQRMNVIESTSKHVEALGESIARIEGGLRDFHFRQPLPVAPAESKPVPAIPGASASASASASDPGITLWEDLEGLDFPDSPSFVTVPDLPEAPEQLWSRLQSWWPSVVDGGTPEGYAGIYTRCLHKAHQTLIAASADRGWKVDVVHVKIPDNSPAGESILQVHEPLNIEEQRIFCSCAPRSPFTDALLFQFALQVRGDQGREIAVLPAPGLRLKGSTESYARLNGGKLPEHATWLAEVTQPAILRQQGTGDLYTVVRPMMARFGSSRGPV